ncbi:hypothetical protein GCM10010123_05120 [Pilimelia anulata]|uniref:Uncharacterized protein n=1 Tax=Pilimelia anulata TaxID=53371 RepID=A0A8J3F7M1_9ACTN|nr:hypothetical protein [Pilimelia anulata]GGJ78041.1 hypothetical protein GCM10010123_05120 [Pilimelia anulata]
MRTIGIALGAAALAVAAPAVPAGAAPAGGDCELLAVPAAGDARDLTVTEVCGADAAAARRSTALVYWYENADWDTSGGTIWGRGGTCDAEGYHVTLDSHASNNISSWQVAGWCHRVVAYNDGGVAATFHGNVNYPGPAHNDNIDQMRITS